MQGPVAPNLEGPNLEGRIISVTNLVTATERPKIGLLETPWKQASQSTCTCLVLTGQLTPLKLMGLGTPPIGEGKAKLSLLL